MNNIIRKYFKNFKEIKYKDVQLFLKKYPLIKQKILIIINKSKIFKNSIEYIRYIVFNITLNKCKICNKILTFKQTIKNKKYCCYKCSAKDKDLIKQRQTTCLNKFGSISPLANKNIQLKSKQTCLQKYGVESTGKLPQCHINNIDFNLRNKKSEDTQLKKYRCKEN